MFPLATGLMLVLHFEGISGDLPHVYSGAGSTALLPCGTSPSSTTTACSGTAWYFKTDGHYTTVVSLGKVVKRLPQASRMSLDPNCSLVIRSIAVEDAGLYMCGQDGYHLTFMSVLKISEHPVPWEDEEVQLQCSLWRPADLGPCLLTSIRWVNETGAVLHGESEGHQADVQGDCSSFLNVTRQTLHSTNYTCQLLDEHNYMTIEVVYTPDTDLWAGSEAWPVLYGWSRVVGLILLVGVTVTVSRHGGQ